jgi:hypothetical protein
MKYVFVLLILSFIACSCATLNSLDDMNCQLGTNKSQNFVGKWKVTSNDGKFVWRFYKDNTTATLANQYLTQIFDKPVFIENWQNDKIDTLRVYFDFDEVAHAEGRSIAQAVREKLNNPNKIDYVILSNECRMITIMNVKTQDTLILKRRQYFYE